MHQPESQQFAGDRPLAGTAAQFQTAIYHHALAVGFSRGFEVSAGIMLIALIVTIVAVRVTRADLAGTQSPQADPAEHDANPEMIERSRPTDPPDERTNCLASLTWPGTARTIMRAVR